MTIQQQDIFFSLLRHAIVCDEDVCVLGNAKPEWDVLIAAFKDHGLLGVVADTIMSLPEEQLPSATEQKEIENHAGTLVRKHWDIDCALVNVFGKLEEHGLHPVLLKGQGFSRLYPMLCTRCACDIDVHCPNGEFFKAAEVMNSICEDKYTREQQEECKHHLHYEYEGEVIELHRWVADTFSDSNAAAVNKWAEQWMKPERCHFINVHDKEIRVPDDYFSFVHCIDHIFKHICSEGVGIRQFVDLAMIYIVLDKTSNISSLTSNLSSDLRTCHLTKPWQTIQSILTLLIPEDDTIKCCISRKHLQKIKDYLFEGGNFGRNYEQISAERYLHDTHGLKRIFEIAHYYLHIHDSLRVFSFNREYWRVTMKEILSTAKYSIGRRLWRSES